MQTPSEIARKAVEDAGGPAVVCHHLGITRHAIYQWKHVPAPHVLRVEKLSGVPRHKLRPDLYPDPETERAERAA